MQLAQLNIAHPKFPLESPEIKEFMDGLDRINSIAEQSDGFIWRLMDEAGDATTIVAFDDPNIIVNMSVWKDQDSLKNFMFRTDHRDFLKRKKEWFDLKGEDTYVLWWVDDGVVPSVEDAVEKLIFLRENGDTARAFTFKSNFSPEDLGK